MPFDGKKIFQNLKIKGHVGDRSLATNNVGNHYFYAFTGVLYPPKNA